MSDKEALKALKGKSLEGLYVLDKNRRPRKARNLLEFARCLGDDERRRVGLTKVKGKTESVQVSTVFLGIDLSGERRVFETMLFGKGWNASRHLSSTWETAERNHDALVLYVEYELANSGELTRRRYRDILKTKTLEQLEHIVKNVVSVCVPGGRVTKEVLIKHILSDIFSGRRKR